MTRRDHQLRHNEELSDALSRVLHSYELGQQRYIENFLHKNKSASDMLQLEVFPNAKEITESYAAFNAAQHKLKFDLSDPNVTLVAVGDGHTPRTATLFAFRTNWKCISIDPGLNTKKIPFWESKVNRLTCIPKYVENLNLHFKKVLIVAVHSHANMQATLSHITGNVRSMIAIPCCISYDGIPPTKEYIDSGIWSPKNRVKIWRDI
jgi:hypothetical protein